eukprot:6186033-Prymnesium_polylepis.1
MLASVEAGAVKPEQRAAAVRVGPRACPLGKRVPLALRLVVPTAPTQHHPQPPCAAPPPHLFRGRRGAAGRVVGSGHF